MSEKTSTEKNISELTKEEINILYTQICASYHAVDDFRAKLLGLLPLGSGLAIIDLINRDHNDQVMHYIPEIGLFGVLITLGLLIYELKGIQKCTGFIYYGHLLEKALLKNEACIVSGQFMGLREPERGSSFATEPVASAFVYASVLAAWVYVATTQNIGNANEPNYSGSMLLTALAGFAIFTGTIMFWVFCSKPKKDLKQS